MSILFCNLTLCKLCQFEAKEKRPQRFRASASSFLAFTRVSLYLNDFMPMRISLFPSYRFIESAP